MIGAVVGDYFGGSTKALGVLILSSVALSRFEVAWAAILVASILGHRVLRDDLARRAVRTELAPLREPEGIVGQAGTMGSASPEL